MRNVGSYWWMISHWMFSSFLPTPAPGVHPAVNVVAKLIKLCYKSLNWQQILHSMANYVVNIFTRIVWTRCTVLRAVKAYFVKRLMKLWNLGILIQRMIDSSNGQTIDLFWICHWLLGKYLLNIIIINLWQQSDMDSLGWERNKHFLAGWIWFVIINIMKLRVIIWELVDNCNVIIWAGSSEHTMLTQDNNMCSIVKTEKQKQNLSWKQCSSKWKGEGQMP